MTAGDVLLSHLAQLCYGEEDTFGTKPASVDSYVGVLNAEPPDEEVDWKPYYFIGNGRDPAVLTEGKHKLEGTLPVILQNPAFLFFLMGHCQETGTDVASGGGSDLDGANAIGDTTVDLTDASDYATDDYIEIDTGGDPEIRQITNVSSNTLTLDHKLRRVHADASLCNEVEAPFTHTLKKANTLPSMTLQPGFDLSTDFGRDFKGTMIDSAEFSCEEDGELQSAFSIKSQLAAKITSLGSPTVLTTNPYQFHQGDLTAHGSAVARFESFRATYQNNLKPKWYMQSTNSKYAYEFLVGKRVLEVTVKIVPEDSTYWDYLIAGTSSVSIVATFTRSDTDYIKFTFSGCGMKTAPHPIPEEHESGVELTYVPTGLEIEGKDSIGYY